MAFPLVRARYLLDHVRGYESLGGDADRLLQRIAVPAELLESPESLIPMARMDELARIAIHDFGFALAWNAAPRRLTDFGPFGARIGAAPSLYDALHTFVTAVRAEATGLRFTFESRPDALWVCWAHDISQDIRLKIHIERCNVHALLTLIRHWAGQRWVPTDLWLRTHAIPEDEELRPIDRVRYHAPVSALSVSHHLLAKSIDAPPLGVATHDDIDLDALDFVEATSRVLETYLRSRPPTIVTVAEALGMSTRSLQRRLSEAGETHSSLLEDVRRRLALTRVEQAGYPITAIAHELGYSDSAHFTRAFRRWFGLSPRELRRLRHGG